MKNVFCFAVFALVLTSCIAIGKGSHKVKYSSYALVGDGNDNDSSFFIVNFKNKSEYPLLEPNLMMTIKDTSGKMLKHTLFSNSVDFEDVQAHTDFSVKLYAKDFYFTDEVGKVKLLLDWTNKKGKTSFRRRIVYE